MYAVPRLCTTASAVHRHYPNRNCPKRQCLSNTTSTAVPVLYRNITVMPLAPLLRTIGKRCWSNSPHAPMSQLSRTLTITCRGSHPKLRRTSIRRFVQSTRWKAGSTKLSSCARRMVARSLLRSPLLSLDHRNIQQHRKWPFYNTVRLYDSQKKVVYTAKFIAGDSTHTYQNPSTQSFSLGR